MGQPPRLSCSVPLNLPLTPGGRPRPSLSRICAHVENVTSNPSRHTLVLSVAVCLLIILLFELTLSIRRETQTWDEACHIFAGYSYWTRGDFGMNPEHPPLLKLLATAPLLSLQLRVPPHPNIFSKEQDFTTATDFVYGNDAETILFRTRMTAASLTLALALILFLATKEMFGSVAALSTLSLFVFEPTVLAHGALVTTDMAMSCFLLATVYCFYRYVKLPTAPRLILTAFAAGLALASKHSGILIFPILIALALTELLMRKGHPPKQATRRQQSFSLAGALIVISIISVALLWASYGFHLHPRPGLD